MRSVLLMVLALGAWAQEQQPGYQAGWPCTGKERAFDPTYSKIAEATGGHLFLFDKSEVAGASALATGDMQHKETIVRQSGKLESYVDIPIPVDASVDRVGKLERITGFGRGGFRPFPGRRRRNGC